MCFARFRRRWDPKGSVINAFATFLLLSYSKLLTVSYSLLDASTLYNNRGKKVSPFVVFFDASIESFSRQHLSFCFSGFNNVLVSDCNKNTALFYSVTVCDWIDSFLIFYNIDLVQNPLSSGIVSQFF